MLSVAPVPRLLTAAMFVAAIFAAQTPSAMTLIYALVLVGVAMCGIVKAHARFLVFVAAPLLLALLVGWGWLVDVRQIPAPHTGLSYAIYSWLKIVASGGILQCLFVPLVERPSELRAFLARTRLSGSFGTLIMSAIVFLPEVRRRLAIIMDARKAQGYRVSGLGGALALPATLMPLVSSLLDSATRRAELWSHRGLVHRQTELSDTVRVQSVRTATVIAVGCAACAIAVTL